MPPGSARADAQGDPDAATADVGQQAHVQDSQREAEQRGISAFLDALFPAVPPAFIEVRIIEDKKGGELLERRWYATRGAALDDLPHLNRIAAERAAAVFFGVLPRKARGGGAAEDTAPSVIAWVDLDFKDFPGGEAEARRRLADFPLKPSIVVRSGHGLHAYWLVREPAEPSELSALSHGLAHALSADRAFDAARMLRLPATMNRKDPQNPILVQIEFIDRGRTCNPSDIRDAVEVVAPGAPPPPKSAAREQPEFTIQPELPAGVRALIQSRKRIGLLFNGKGKPELGADGKPLDTSSSGYDFSLVMALLKAGVREPSDLASALWHRPDGAAQAKGVGYISRTVSQAIELIESADQANASLAVDFEVERLLVFASNPARYEFTISGVSFTVSSPQLRSPRLFATAFLDALHRVPVVPAKGDEWAGVVNHWLQQAERVQMPPDASYEPALREAIEHAVEEMAVGDMPEDLDHGKAVALLDGRRGFKVNAVLRRLRDDYPNLQPNELAATLKKLGFSSHSTSVKGTSVRLWRSDRTTD